MKNKILILFIAIIIGIFYECQSQTSQDVYNACVELGIRYPEIVTAQTLKETGWYTCENCSFRFNNILGFRHSSNEVGGNTRGYFKYNHWKRCLYYALDWQQRKYKGGNYYEFLYNLPYAENMEEYNADVKWIVNKINLN